jgi:hypothetical protein
MRFPFRSRLAALAISGLSLGLATPMAHAGLETLKLTPIFNETIYGGQHDQDTFACFPITCFFTSGLVAVPAQSPAGQFAVGFHYFNNPGTKPCNCSEFAVYAHRGAMFFKSADLPHFFLTARLVLTPKTGKQTGNSQTNLITGLFEVSHKAVVSYSDQDPAAAADGDFFLLPAQLTQYGVDGRLTLLREALKLSPNDGMLSAPVFPPFPANPGPTNQQVTKNGLAYSMDVTSTVHNWVVNWPNHAKTPMRGFVVTGPDETLSHDKTTSFVNNYEAQLVFTIEDQPL